MCNPFLKVNNSGHRRRVNRIIFFSLALLLSGCEGILDTIYDEAPADDVFSEGFHRGATENQWTLQVVATSYDEWVYVDVHRQTLERHPIPRELTGSWDGRSGLTYQLVEGSQWTKLSDLMTDAQTEPEEWDFAIHHFDVKTNGGAVARVGSETYTEDEWTDNQVIVDMREMMGYRIGYQNSFVNRLLSSWVTMDFSTPPPTYAASGDTYILKMKDGTKATMRLRSYMSERGTKGFLTIDIRLTNSASASR